MCSRQSAAPGICIDIDGQWWHDPGSCPHCRPRVYCPVHDPDYDLEREREHVALVGQD